MSFHDLFSDKAELYAQARPQYPQALFVWLAENAPTRELAWDCATGNGQAALSLAEYFAQVYASDASAAQIAHALPAARVRYAVEPAEHCQLASASADLVCVAQALHWFQLETFFAEVRRVLKPGGLFAAWGYDWLRIHPEFDATFQRSILEVVQAEWAPELRLLWNGYADLQLPFERLDSPAFAIRAEWNFWQLLAYVQTWSAVRRAQAKIGNGFFDAAGEALLPLWGPAERTREINMPLHLLAGRVSDEL